MASDCNGLKPAFDFEFDKFRNLVENNEGWTKQYKKNKVEVFTKSEVGTAIKMVKIETHFDDISLDVLYDTLHDGDYRKNWDSMMIEEYGLCQIDPNSDVGYYAAKCPKPLRNRDFVFQRYWTKTQNSFIICNHSVQHKNAPIRKDYIRGTSLMSGYMAKTNGICGSHFIYISQVDPKGSIPKWMVNKVATKTAPKVMASFASAAKNYTNWKIQNNPDYKPWLKYEQNNLPLAKLADFKSSPMLDSDLSRKLDFEAHALSVPNGDTSD